ncbi:MAG TPA: amidohydrolase family protein [Steroidobacteraceae bacterium]|nr:amidohydrolase family protein [Steroidobacteraceae bacterium]
MRNLDLIITNGTIVDGTGAPARPGGVAIADDRIVAVGELASGAAAASTIDARGGLICPGFIDIHTHSDVSVVAHPCCASKIHQGVTTEVVGNCGFSAFPLDLRHLADHADLLRMIGRVDVPLDWSDLDGFAAVVERARPAINVAPLVGHGSLRIAAGVDSAEAVTAPDRARMRRLLARCFEQGAFGFTTGLTYVPSCLAGPAEISDLVGLTASYDRLYATHARGLLGETGALEEAAAVGLETGVRLQYSHLAINQPANWGTAGSVLARFHEFRRRGTDIAFDVYPYDASSSALTQHLPAWVQQGGIELLRGRLADPANRIRVLRELSHDWWDEQPWMWERFVISAAPGANELIGRSIQALAADAHVAPEEMVLRLCEQFGNEVHIVLHYRQERDVVAFMNDELASIGSDGLALPARDDFGRPHPRSFGCFPRVLGRFVRDLSAMSLVDAVRKMTGAPADRLRLRDRGRLAPGCFADVLVIDPGRVADRATYLDPIALAVGLEAVVVNGRVAVRADQETGVRAGRLLRYAA